MVAILVHGMSSFSPTSPFLVNLSKFAVTGYFIKMFLVFQNFVIRTPEKKVHIITPPEHAASVLGAIEKSFSCLDIGKKEQYHCKRSVEIRMIDKLIAYRHQRHSLPSDLGVAGSELPF